MTKLSDSSCVCAALALAGATVARAEPPAKAPDETVIIVDDAPKEGARDRERALGDAPFVTVLHPDDHPATASVADALATTAGAQTRRERGWFRKSSSARQR